MGDADQREARLVATLPEDDRVWLEARVVEYRDLLAYLRDH
jgi:hypothetical protein